MTEENQTPTPDAAEVVEVAPDPVPQSPAEPVATEPVAPDQLASDGEAVRPGLTEETPNES